MRGLVDYQTFPDFGPGETDEMAGMPAGTLKPSRRRLSPIANLTTACSGRIRQFPCHPPFRRKLKGPSAALDMTLPKIDCLILH
jgi:hypothetical protein